MVIYEVWDFDPMASSMGEMYIAARYGDRARAEADAQERNAHSRADFENTATDGKRRAISEPWNWQHAKVIEATVGTETRPLPDGEGDCVMGMFSADSDQDYHTEMHGPYPKTVERVCVKCRRVFREAMQGEYDASPRCDDCAARARAEYDAAKHDPRR